MKFLAVIALVLLAGSSVESQGLPLADAMIQLREVLRLQSWAAAWGVRRTADNAVCLYSNELNAPDVFWPARVRIAEDPLYQFIESTMVSGGVPWDSFMKDDLLPALGVHDLVSNCPSGSVGGVQALRDQLRGYFDDVLVDATVERLHEESPAFAQLFDQIYANQAGIHAIRCSAEVQRVEQIKRGQGVDFQFVFEMLRIIFGWGSVQDCSPGLPTPITTDV